MKTTFTLLFALCSVYVFSQQEHAHCQHHCTIEKTEIGPVYNAARKANTSKYKTNSLTHFIGSTHQHSGFSDGFPGTTPADYFASGRKNGFDFVFGADHSDSYIIPVTLHDECLSENLLDCIAINPFNPIGSIIKWPEFAKIQQAHSDSSFAAIRGFEWTSDRFGHINVYFSKHLSNAKTDGGYVLLETFWNWFTTDPINIAGLEAILGGYGARDGLGVFNHPGDKSLYDDDPGFNWNNFEYIPKADSQMVGIEVFNDGRDYAANGRAFYQQALDAGWHVGAVASEDHHDTLWNNNQDEKTIIVAKSLMEADLKTAMKNRRTYAVRDFDLRMNFTAGNNFMGSRIQRKTGSIMRLSAEISTKHDVLVEIVSNENEIIASFSEKSFQKDIEVQAEEKWYYLRIANAADSSSLAYSSPIWISGGGDVAEEPVGVSELAMQNAIQIFPNPVFSSNPIITVLSPNDDIAQIEVYNLSGKQFFVPVKQSHQKFHLNLHSLENGMYFLYCGLKKSNTLVRKKIMVQ